MLILLREKEHAVCESERKYRFIAFAQMKKNAGLIQLTQNWIMMCHSKSTIPKLDRRIFSCWTKLAPVAYSVSSPTANPNIAHLQNHQTTSSKSECLLISIGRWPKTTRETNKLSKWWYLGIQHSPGQTILVLASEEVTEVPGIQLLANDEEQHARKY